MPDQTTATIDPPAEHQDLEWHWLRWKDDPPTVALWDGDRMKFVRGEASGNTGLLHRLGWRYVAPCIPPESANGQ